MIVKVIKCKDYESGICEEEIYSKVANVYKYYNSNEDEVIRLEYGNKEEMVMIPVTLKTKEGNHPSLVSSVWLMNDEGKTIERLV